MARARTASRQPSAGPSRRQNAANTRATFPEGVIELTDSEDEQRIKPPCSKRRKIIHVASETIDLTLLSSPTFSASSLGKSSFANASDGKDARSLTESATGREKGKEKAFTDVTNDQNIQGAPSTRPTPVALDSDVPAVAEVLQETPTNPLDRYLSQILEVVPDVEPDHARSLLDQHYTTSGADVVATVLHILFEQSYPKIERNKGKRKREDEVSTSKNYGSKDRKFEGGNHYYEMAMNQLVIDFPRIPIPHIRQVLLENNSLYAPTHLALREQLNQGKPPFKLKSIPTKPSGKGKCHDPEFERELAWLLTTIKDGAKKVGDHSEGTDDDDGECEDGIECGCCFSTYLFDKMIQCPDAHLFCKGCMRSYVENQLGQHDPNILCMDQSGCKLPFAYTELKRFLSAKLLDLYERVKQAKEIEAAELDGLEECPFCEYKVVIDNPDEKLFRCEREECGAVSCRECKKLDHLPKSCKEAEEDNGLDARHKVEEAMTGALMRNCPKCKKAFIKEGGCNKMSCPNCRTLSCYVCRQIITGYDHFDQRPHNQIRGQGSSSKQKCSLWDPVEVRHDREVAEAREKAIKEVEAANPEVDRKQLEVELPRTAQDANNARVGQGPLGNFNLLGRVGVAVPEMFHHHIHHHHHLRPLQPPAVQAPQGGVPLYQRLGLGFDFNLDFNAFMPGAPPLFAGQQVPPAAAEEARRARQAAMAERREAVLQLNEARRNVLERQERVRQAWEANMAVARQRREDEVVRLQRAAGQAQNNNARPQGMFGAVNVVHNAQVPPAPAPQPAFIAQQQLHARIQGPIMAAGAPPPPYFIAAAMPGVPFIPIPAQQPQATNPQLPQAPPCPRCGVRHPVLARHPMPPPPLLHIPMQNAAAVRPQGQPPPPAPAPAAPNLNSDAERRRHSER